MFARVVDNFILLYTTLFYHSCPSVQVHECNQHSLCFNKRMLPCFTSVESYIYFGNRMVNGSIKKIGSFSFSQHFQRKKINIKGHIWLNRLLFLLANLFLCLIGNPIDSKIIETILSRIVRGIGKSSKNTPFRVAL